MNFEEILSMVRIKFGQADIGGIEGKLAIQMNLTGENGGVFYVEVLNGKLSIEPYEYNDRDVKLIMSADNFLKMVDGKLDPVVAFSTGRLKVEGDMGKALQLNQFINQQ